MKRFVKAAVFCILGALLLAACGRLTEDKNVTVIEISEETAAYRDEMFPAGDIASIPEETLAAVLSAELEEFSTRTVQYLPDVATANPVTEEDLGAESVYSIRSGEDYDCVVLYIHGGAWIYEIDPIHVFFCDKMATELNAKVYIPLYPLAPNAGHEEMYEYLEQVYAEVLQEGKPVYVMGDSAGATISLGFVLKLKDEGVQLPDKVVVMAPCPDASFSNPEIADYAEKDGMLPVYTSSECAKLWADGEDMTSPYVSPLYGDYAMFPDTLLFIGTYDILYPDNMKLKEVMEDAEVSLSVVKGEGFWHVFPLYDTAEQAQCVEIIREFCE